VSNGGVRLVEEGVITILDEVVLRQTLQACGARKASGENETDGGSKPVPLRLLPPVDVLQERRE